MVNHHLGVIVTTNDGTPFESAFSPIVDVNDPPFFLDSNGDKLLVDTITIEMNESNGTNLEVYNANARDVENQGITFSLDGVDASDFSIDSSTGVVKLLAAPTPGTKTFKVIASDTDNATSTLNLTLNINSTAVLEVRYSKMAPATVPANAFVGEQSAGFGNTIDYAFTNFNVTKVEVKINKNNITGNTNGTEYIIGGVATLHFNKPVLIDDHSPSSFNSYFTAGGTNIQVSTLASGHELSNGTNNSADSDTWKIDCMTPVGEQLDNSYAIHANNTWVTLFYARNLDNTGEDLPYPISTNILLWPLSDEVYNESDQVIVTPSPVEVITNSN